MLSSDPNKSSLQRKNNSGELDVFEAARYFSTANNDQNSDSYYLRQNNNARKSSSRARMSLDLMPTQTNNNIPIHHHVALLDPKTVITKESSTTKHKHQPTSPGGKLASFLNSIFNQRHLKTKKKSKPDKDFEDENAPGLRRKRRSSISHFIRSTTSSNINHTSTIAAAASSSAAAAYANSTPTKQVISLPKNSGMDHECMEEKSRISNGVFSEKISRNGSFGFSSNNSTINYRKFSDEDDDGADSDSSSDLFDLPNHDLDFCTNDLPVYETTHVNRIKIAKPISRATAV